MTSDDKKINLNPIKRMMLRQRKRAFKKQPHPSQEAIGKRPTHPLAIVEAKAKSRCLKHIGKTGT